MMAEIKLTKTFHEYECDHCKEGKMQVLPKRDYFGLAICLIYNDDKKILHYCNFCRAKTWLNEVYPRVIDNKENIT